MQRSLVFHNLMPPRTLIIGNFLSASRANRGVCEELASRLRGAGWEVLTTSSRPQRVARLADMLQTAWRQRTAYDVAQVDVYSGTAFIWAEAVAACLRLAGKPYVLTLHGGNLPRFARRWPRRVRRLLGSARVVTTPSAYLREELRPYRDDLLLLPNAIDASNYRGRMRCPVRPRLIWLRAFHDIYNPMLAPKVVARLADVLPDVHLAMAGADTGDGTLPATRHAIRELGIEHRVEIRPGVAKADVPAWLDAGDIFLNTANVDNAPVSVIEAMAAGLCVVSANVGGIPYLLEDGTDALLVPPDDPEAMANAVRRLVADAALAGALSRAGRQKAEQLDWSAILPRWQTLLTTVAAGR